MGTDKRARQKAGRAERLQVEAKTQQRDQRKRTLIGLVVVVAAVVVIAFLANLSGKKSNKTKTATGATTTVAAAATTVPGPTTSAGPTTTQALPAAKPFVYGTTACPATDGSSKRTIDFKAAPKNCLVAGKTYTATIKTNVGTVVVALDTTKTPGTTNNFAVLSGYHFYDNTKLFRVSTSIDIIQGGSPHTESASDPGPGYALQDEPTLAESGGQVTRGPYSYSAGDLVMARTGAVDGAGAQFFFVTGPHAAGLDSQGTYVTFGHVTSGLDILKKIVATAKADPASTTGDQTPNPAVTIKTVTVTAS